MQVSRYPLGLNNSFKNQPVLTQKRGTMALNISVGKCKCNKQNRYITHSLPNWYGSLNAKSLHTVPRQVLAVSDSSMDELHERFVKVFHVKLLTVALLIHLTCNVSAISIFIVHKLAAKIWRPAETSGLLR